MRTVELMCAAVLCGATGCQEEISTGCSTDPYRVAPRAPLSRDAALDEWAGAAREDGTRERCAEVYEGACADGTYFLLWESSSASDAAYFDDGGEVRGGVHREHFIIDGCSGNFFGDIRCKDPVGAPLCGEVEAAPILLPYAD
jgi:hypothetical protein